MPNENGWYKDTIEIQKEGLETLGSPIGSDAFVADFCNEKFEELGTIIDKLTKMASIFPQHAFRLFSQSTKFRLTHIIRTVANAHQYSEPYQASIKKFIEMIFGSQLEDAKLQEIRPPINEGGLGIDLDLKASNDQQFAISRKVLDPTSGPNKYQQQKESLCLM